MKNAGTIQKGEFVIINNMSCEVIKNIDNVMTVVLYDATNNKKWFCSIEYTDECMFKIR